MNMADNYNETVPSQLSTQSLPLTQSTFQTFTGIFLDPSATFESLRKEPRFSIALSISVLITIAAIYLTFNRIGYENILNSAPSFITMSPEQKERAIESMASPSMQLINYIGYFVTITITFILGAWLYWVAVMLMGKSISYKQSLAVWSYSSFPPIILSVATNLTLLFLQSPQDIDITRASRLKLAQSNLGILVDQNLYPVLGTALGSIDLFILYGLLLAAIGLRKVANLSSGYAWGITLSIWSIGLILRLLIAALTGTAMY
jgi:hypothetical protein